MALKLGWTIDDVSGQYVTGDDYDIQAYEQAVMSLAEGEQFQYLRPKNMTDRLAWSHSEVTQWKPKDVWSYTHLLHKIINHVRGTDLDEDRWETDDEVSLDPKDKARRVGLLWDGQTYSVVIPVLTRMKIRSESKTTFLPVEVSWRILLPPDEAARQDAIDVMSHKKATFAPAAYTLWRTLSTRFVNVSLSDCHDFMDHNGGAALKLHARVGGHQGETMVIIPKGPHCHFQLDMAHMPRADKSSEGKNYILFMIDLFTKFLWSWYLRGATAEMVWGRVKPILEQEVAMAEDPKTVIVHTDNGSEFKKEFSAGLEGMGIRHIRGYPYHSWSQGGVERVGRTIKGMLYAYQTHSGSKAWTTQLDEITENYNNRIHSSIGLEPAKVHHMTNPALWDDPAIAVRAAAVQDLIKSKFRKRQAKVAKAWTEEKVFKVGQVVHLLRMDEKETRTATKITFRKKYLTNYSPQLWMIRRISYGIAVLPVNPGIVISTLIAHVEYDPDLYSDLIDPAEVKKFEWQKRQHGPVYTLIPIEVVNGEYVRKGGVKDKTVYGNQFLPVRGLKKKGAAALEETPDVGIDESGALGEEGKKIPDKKIMKAIPYKEDIARRLEAVGKKEGLKMERLDTPGAGNCQFEAIVLSLRNQPNVPQRVKDQKWTAASLRTALVKFLRSLGESNWVTVPDGEDQVESNLPFETWEEYLTKLEQEGGYGDHISLTSLAALLRMEVRVVIAGANYALDSYQKVDPFYPLGEAWVPGEFIIWIANQPDVHFEGIRIGARPPVPPPPPPPPELPRPPNSPRPPSPEPFTPPPSPGVPQTPKSPHGGPPQISISSEDEKPGYVAKVLRAPETASSRLSAVGKKYGLVLERRHTPGDGDCQFHAVAGAFKTQEVPEDIKGQHWSHRTLRTAAVNWLREHPVVMRSGQKSIDIRHQVAQPGQTWEAYLEEMSTSGKFGTQTTLQALATFFQMRVNVILVGQSQIEGQPPPDPAGISVFGPFDLSKPRFTIWLLNMDNWHYEFLAVSKIPQESRPPSPPRQREPRDTQGKHPRWMEDFQTY